MKYLQAIAIAIFAVSCSPVPAHPLDWSKTLEKELKECYYKRNIECVADFYTNQASRQECVNLKQWNDDWKACTRIKPQKR